MGTWRCPQMLLLLLLLALSPAAAASEGGKNWCYQSQKCQKPGCEEPRQWEHSVPECGKKKQSPINIITSEVVYDWELQPFRFENYDTRQKKNWTVRNDGHTVKVELDGSAKISLGGLTGTYKAIQFHFHWGYSEGLATKSKASPGSEHSIDGKRYAMELHIVHMRDDYTSLADAIANKGVAVLGFFIEAGKENLNYEPLLSTFDSISYKGNSTVIPPLCLNALIPKKSDLNRFYRYVGSLTTPDCNEDVIWTLFEKPIEMKLEQIQEFWMNLYFGSTKDWPMMDNFRPTQPLEGRVVTRSDSGTLLPPGKAWLLIPTAAYLAVSAIL